MKNAIRTIGLLPFALVALTGCADTRWALLGPGKPPDQAAKQDEEKAEANADAKPRAKLLPASWFAKSDAKDKEPAAPETAPSSGEFFSGDDAVGTKLDLARAYLDMGDPEGARSMLQEVLTEGNAAQRAEAQRLIDEI